MTLLERPGLDYKRNYRFARWRFYSYEKAPLFKADWTNLVFHHFKVDKDLLKEAVPFELDLFEGNAYVSLVGFRTTRMTVNHMGEWTRWLYYPISHHSFLNVRTYVKNRGEPGIFFMKEYVDSLPAIPIGRMTYGLPYHFGKVNFDHEFTHGKLAGSVATKLGGELNYRAERLPGEGVRKCEPGSEAEFLAERYSAFTCQGKLKRVFRILHEPWDLTALKNEWLDTTLLETDSPWFEGAEAVGSYWTRGAFDVKISRPRRIG